MGPSLQDVGLAVKQLQWRHHREANRRLSTQVGLSLVQWDVLRHLHQRPDSSLRALAELTFQTDQSMGELARRMVDRGLLERVEGAGRAVRHRITDEGSRLHEGGRGVFEGVLTESVGRLLPAERAMLYELLVKAAKG